MNTIRNADTSVLSVRNHISLLVVRLRVSLLGLLLLPGSSCNNWPGGSCNLITFCSNTDALCLLDLQEVYYRSDLVKMSEQKTT